ncbi:MAG: NusG domain II-containing protein [Oscillospiraceae bacterium]|nr:NusG domain II-containing protein [Oscillospiraceae bacterium]
MRSSIADRSRPTWGDGLLILLVLVAAGALFLVLRPVSGQRLTATVIWEGETVAQYDLSKVTQSERLRLDQCPYPLSIELEPGRIRIAESSCPGTDCVHIGWASRPGQQIICLPNHLYVSLWGEGTSEQIDAVTG